jgi:hypothetical protein
MNHFEHGQLNATPAWRSRLVLVGFLSVVGFFLWTEHRAHLFGALPYLLFLACPLMHLFHHGHGHHGASHNPGAQTGRVVAQEEERHEQ